MNAFLNSFVPFARLFTGSILTVCLLTSVFPVAADIPPEELGLSTDEPLPPEQAFVLSTSVTAADMIRAEWDIVDGYYLYREKFKFTSNTPDISLQEAVYPKGKIKVDEFFGEVETYRGKIAVDIPIGLKLKTEELGYSTLFLQLGFNPMILLNAKGSSEDASFKKEDIRESINLFGLGYHAGLGVEYALGGRTALIGGLRWSSGFTDVTDNDRANVKTNAITIHLGILF